MWDEELRGEESGIHRKARMKGWKRRAKRKEERVEEGGEKRVWCGEGRMRKVSWGGKSKDEMRENMFKCERRDFEERIGGGWRGEERGGRWREEEWGGRMKGGGKRGRIEWWIDRRRMKNKHDRGRGGGCPKLSAGQDWCSSSLCVLAAPLISPPL